MSSHSPNHLTRVVGRWLAAVLLLLGVVIAAQAQPSQKPLLSRDGGGVKPNIMLTMDDSGSMMFQHMPERTVFIGSYTLTSPPEDNSVRFDPGDNAILSSFFIGTIAGRPGSANWRQRLLRSPEGNTIYYNPEVRYRPWPLAAGGRMAEYPASAAPRDPMNPVAGGTVNLTNTRTISDSSLVWCYRTDSASDCGTTNSGVVYDPGLYYRLNKDGSGNYLSPTNATNYTQFTINAASSTTYTKYSNRTDCAGTVCTRAEERQNFSNWFTYYRTRNLLARGAIAEAFNDLGDTFRLGWGRINKGTESSIDGVNTRVIESGVRDYTALRKVSLFDWIYALPASGGTPLRRAIQQVGNYYSRTDNRGPWTDSPGSLLNNTANDKSCRRAYHILVTDGYWNDTTGSTAGLSSVGNVDNANGPSLTGPGRTYQYTPSRPFRDGNSDRLADYAMYYWNRDLNPNLANKVLPSADNPAFWQHMVNFTVGLGVRGPLNPDKDLPSLTSGTKTWGTDEIDDLWHTALNSRGNTFSAKDPTELADSVRSAIGQTLQRELREAGVATASTILEDGNRKYVPLYKTGAWSGDVQAFSLDANGQAGAVVWNASERLPAWASRNIVTWDSGIATPAAVTFTWANISAGNRSALGAITASFTATFVDFLRGDRSREGDDKPFRARSGVLGDFINSNPVLIKGALDMGYATLPTIGSTYPAFLAAKAARSGVLFVGGNDGMLHAFRDTKGADPANDGREVFAYVPRAVYPSLSLLASKSYGTEQLYHQFFVDGPLREADVYVNAPAAGSPSWRNYLLGSLGSGGRAVFALDVTDSANLGAANVRWEISSANDGDLGFVYAPIETGVLPNGEWVAIFGNGYYSNAGKATLMVVNLQTRAIAKLDVDTTGSNGLGGVAVVRNGSGQITTLYAGDMKGKLWKFTYSAAATSRFAIAGGTAFFNATDSGGTAQPITQPPVIYPHSQGGDLVLFGTGLLLTESHADNTSTQSIYAVWDKPGDTVLRPFGRSLLVTRTLTSVDGSGGATFYSLSGTAVDWVTQRGWVLDLSVIPGLRVIYPPQAVTYELALVSTVAPAKGVVPCESSTGSGINFLLMVEEGLNPPYKLFDTNGDGAFNSSDIEVAGYASGADGIDAIVYSQARTGSNAVADGPCPAGYYRVSIQNTTGQQMVCVRRQGGGGGGAVTIQDRLWRRIINPPIR